jgi:hypothetical protein
MVLTENRLEKPFSRTPCRNLVVLRPVFYALCEAFAAMTAPSSTPESKKSQADMRWLNRNVLGIGLASLFSDWSHEIATTLMPAFLASMGVAAAWLGLIEGVSDGLSSFAKMGSGYYTDKLPRRKSVAVLGYVIRHRGNRTGHNSVACFVGAFRCVARTRRANSRA